MHIFWQKSKDWFIARADSTHAKVWLAALSFTDASIFFIPPDPLLVAIVLVHQKRWVWYAAFTMAFSVLGALFGYLVGAVFFDVVGVRIIEFYNLGAAMEQARVFINESLFVFTLTVAFTPIPFKVAALSAGFAKANIATFLLATILGRIARYFLVAYVAKMFGDRGELLLRRFWWIATIAGVLGLALYLLYILI